MWQTLTTHDGTVNDKNVSTVLSVAKSQLIKGILVYEKYTDKSFSEWKEKQKFKDSAIPRFIKKLSITLASFNVLKNALFLNNDICAFRI